MDKENAILFTPRLGRQSSVVGGSGSKRKLGVYTPQQAVKLPVSVIGGGAGSIVKTPRSALRPKDVNTAHLTYTPGSLLKSPAKSKNSGAVSVRRALESQPSLSSHPNTANRIKQDNVIFPLSSSAKKQPLSTTTINNKSAVKKRSGLTVVWRDETDDEFASPQNINQSNTTLATGITKATKNNLHVKSDKDSSHLNDELESGKVWSDDYDLKDFVPPVPVALGNLQFNVLASSFPSFIEDDEEDEDEDHKVEEQIAKSKFDDSELLLDDVSFLSTSTKRDSSALTPAKNTLAKKSMLDALNQMSPDEPLFF